MNGPSVHAQLTALALRLDQAERSFSEPLSDFQNDVERLCRELLAMPREAAQSYVTPMEALIARLERLQKNIALPAEETPRTGARQASKAYRQFSRPLPPGESTH